MLIDERCIRLEPGEAYDSLCRDEMLRVARGSAQLYYTKHTQRSKVSPAVRSLRSLDKGDAVASRIRVDDAGEVYCYTLVAGEQGAELERLTAVMESRIHIGEGMSYYADDNEAAFWVESGLAYVHIAPAAVDGVDERRQYLCCASPEDRYAIPGMRYEKDGRIWRLQVVAQTGTVCLRKIPVTKPGREIFLREVDQEQTDPANLIESYKHEGFEQSLIQYYTRNNGLADTIRDSRSDQYYGGVQRKLQDVIDGGETDPPFVPDEDKVKWSARGTADNAGGRLRSEGGNEARDSENDEESLLYRALRYLCLKGKIVLPAYSDLIEKCPSMSLQEISREAGFLCREVKLSGTWYRGDCGMLIAVLDGEPVACMPGIMGYRVFRPSSGRESRLTPAQAERISRKACAVAPMLPEENLGPGDIVCFALRGVSPVWLVLALCAGFVHVMLGLLFPMVIRAVCDMLAAAGGEHIYGDLCWPALALLAGGIPAALLCSMLVCRCSLYAERRLQEAMFARLFSLPSRLLRVYGSGELTRRIRSFGTVVSRLTVSAISALLLAAAVLMYSSQMAYYCRDLLLPLIAPLGMYAAADMVIAARLHKGERLAAAWEGEVTAKLQQLLGIVQRVRLAGAESRAVLECMKPISGKMKAVAHVDVLRGFSTALRCLTGGIAAWVVLRYAGSAQNTLSVGRIAAFGAAGYALYASVFRLMDVVDQCHEIKQALVQLYPLLQCESLSGGDGKRVERLKGRITFEHVVFSYKDHDSAVLDDVNLDIQPGEYVGIVGRSGSGKTTLLRLMLGLEEPTTGHVLYDGEDIKGLDKRSLRRRLGVVLQENSLVAGTIYENIALLSEFPDRETAEMAAEMAGLKADLDAMPMHMDTLVNETGNTLSGGQKQRILLARAIACEPDILMLDEATSALDNAVQAEICDELEQMRMTRLVIAHRLSTIERCDRILVLDGGKIVEQGSYNELMAAGGLFCRMAKRQLFDTDEGGKEMNRIVSGNRMTLEGSGQRLTIDARMQENTAVLMLCGAVTMELEDELIDEILAIVSAGRSVTLDMHQIDHVSSTVLKKLVDIQRRYIDHSDVRLELQRVPPQIFAEFRRSRLDTQLIIRQDR